MTRNADGSWTMAEEEAEMIAINAIRAYDLWKTFGFTFPESVELAMKSKAPASEQRQSIARELLRRAGGAA